jgi:hypothetical protein
VFVILAAAYEPAKHGVHRADPGVENVPPGHAEQFCARAPLTNPEGQGMHKADPLIGA